MKLKLLGTTLLMAIAGVFAAAPAQAKIEEVRFGLVGNVRLDHGDLTGGKYGALNAEIELVSNSPDFLNFIGSPRPYAFISVPTAEDSVTFGGIGLVWRWEFADGWAFEPGFGYVIHDGELDNPFPDLTPEAAAFEAEHQLLGSRDLFRTTFALEREFGARAAVQLYWEHMSHGQVLDQGRNQGLDYVGLRILYRFSDDPAE
jgi:lipid A 3-O-deacylase